MVYLRFYPIDITYKVLRDVPVIHIYGRTYEGKQICITDDRFKPYFYVIPKSDSELTALFDILKKVDQEIEGTHVLVLSVDETRKVIDGKEVTALKVTVNIPKSIPILKEYLKDLPDIESMLEYDILFTRRYLVDNKITPLVITEAEVEPNTDKKEKSRVPVYKALKLEQTENETLEKFRILAFDIETYNPGSTVAVPERHPISMIALYGKGYKKVITWKHFETDLDYVEFVEGEAQLLQRFKESVSEYAPDILTGYYSDGFDLPFIIKRGQKHDVNFDASLDFESLRLSKGKLNALDMNGIVHLDILNFIKRVISRKLKTDSLKLDSVSEELLSEKKDVVDFNEMMQAWEVASPKLSEFAKYNLKDARLTYELCELILPNLIELIKIVGQDLKSVNRMSFSQLVEWYLIKRADEFGQFIPNKPGRGAIDARMGQRVKGAFVFEPIPGFYENVVVFDFRSLYPSIIVSHNISIETINCDCCQQTIRVPLDNKEIWFCEKKEGFFAIVLGDIISRRARVKEIMKRSTPEKKVFLDARQESLKTLANSFYGYLGFFAARWYTKDSARSVTAYGRHYIHKVIDTAKKKGFGVLYSDTDSIFMHLGDRPKEDAIHFCEQINSKLPGVMELEYEGSYPRALFVAMKEADTGAKKRYALIDENNKIIIKGFESVRRNVSAIAKHTQEEVLRIILEENNPKKALDFARDTIKDLKDKKISAQDLAISTQLSKKVEEYTSIGPPVAIAQHMIEKRLDVFPGMIVKYVVIPGKDKIRDRVKMPDEISEGEYDADYYLHHQVLPAIDKIFEVFGYEVEEISQEISQSKLGSYF